MICHILASKMKFKQIACLYLVLHVSHLMVMSRSLDENGMDTAKREVADEKKQELATQFGDLLKDVVFDAKESKAAKFKVEKSTCQLPDFRLLLGDASVINRLVQDLLERLLRISNLKGL